MVEVTEPWTFQSYKLLYLRVKPCHEEVLVAVHRVYNIIQIIQYFLTHYKKQPKLSQDLGDYSQSLGLSLAEEEFHTLLDILGG